MEHESRMRNSRKLTHRSVRIRLIMLLLSTVTVAAWPQTVPDFSGTWKQDNDRCQPKRSGDVMLHIENHDTQLTVETTISHGSLSSRHAVQKYTTDGKVSISTGTDGDEFNTSVVWKDSSLVFTIEEHEAGRVLRSQETCHSSRMAQRYRELASAQMERNRSSFYRRQQSSPAVGAG
jgi:hypothetical protein